MHPVELRGENVVVREVRDDDFEAIRVYAADPEVHRWLIWRTDEPEDTRRWIAEVQANARRPERAVYELVIAEPDTDLVVGGVRLGIDSFVNRSGSLGYVLRRDRWGKGLVTEAARLVVGFGFEQLGLHRIIATCAPENVASMRVMEKIGMQREGLLRERVKLDGKWWDALLYAILETDPR